MFFLLQFMFGIKMTVSLKPSLFFKLFERFLFQMSYYYPKFTFLQQPIPGYVMFSFLTVCTVKEQCHEIFNEQNSTLVPNEQDRCACKIFAISRIQSRKQLKADTIRVSAIQHFKNIAKHDILTNYFEFREIYNRFREIFAKFLINFVKISQKL